MLRSDFSSSRLVRVLGEWAPVDPAADGMDFAERLGLGLNVFDAIGLQAAHRAIHAMDGPATAADPAAGRARWQALREEVQRLRAALAQAIGRELVPAALDAPEAAGYARYRQRHATLQRQMEQAIAPLREQVRQALREAGARLRQLAALDAALEPVIAAREQAHLPGVATLLEKRFEQLRRADEPGWRALFAAQWRNALQAECELRLAPLTALIDALGKELGNELKNQP